MKTNLLFLVLIVSQFNPSFSQQWQPLGTGLISLSTTQAANMMLIDSANQNLYVSGKFDRAGGFSVDNIARWNGTQWYSMGSEFEDTPVGTLIFFNNELYAGSYLDPEHGIGPMGKWNGSNWVPYPFDPSVIPFITSISDFAIFQNELYACGFVHYSVLDGRKGLVAKYDGVTWHVLKGGLYGNGGDALLVYNNELYVSGEFWLADSMPVSNIAKWDGTQWSDVGGGINQRVYCMEEYNGSLYAGGYNNNIYKWNGTLWEQFASTNSSIATLKSYNGDLYAGGYFTTINNDPINKIAKWDGSQWNRIASGTFNNEDSSGLYNGINDIEIFQGNLHAVGWFTEIDSVQANSIARWQIVSGIKNTSPIGCFRISPNPATDYFLLENLSQERDLELRIFSVTGSLISNQSLNNRLEKINLGDFPKGLLLYSISSNTEVIDRGKIINLTH